MTTPLEQQAREFAKSWCEANGKNSRHVRIKFAVDFAETREREIEALRAKVRELESYAALGRWALEVSRDDWTDVDAGDLQDLAQSLGCLVSVTVTEPCCDDCQCAEFGDFPTQCLRMVPPIPLPGEEKL